MLSCENIYQYLSCIENVYSVHLLFCHFCLIFSVRDYNEHFEPIDNEDNPDLLVENWPSLNEPYQRQASNIENHRHKKSSDKWNVNNVVDNLVQNSNLTTEVKMNFIHVLHANEQLNKALHEKKQSKMFIPHVFTAEWSNSIKKRRLKRNEMSEDVFQVDNETNRNNVENKNVNALMGNQKHKKGAKMIPIENDGKQQQQQNTVKDSVVSYSVYNLSESTPQHTTRIKLFQKRNQKWKILENEIM